MRTDTSSPHLYAFSRMDGGYVDLGPASKLDRVLASFTAGLTTRPVGLIVRKKSAADDAQDVYEGPKTSREV